MATDRYEDLRKTNFWDRMIELRDEQREQRKNGVQVVKGAKLPLELNRQGLMRWYMHPEITDTVLSTFLFYQQEIPPGSRSGRVKFQGNAVMYILEGNGFTLLDGVKHEWRAGDVVNLPIKKAESWFSISTSTRAGASASHTRSQTCMHARAWTVEAASNSSKTRRNSTRTHSGGI